MSTQPGSQLLALVAVMDRLRSPGGCPWDAEQTHRSLAPYLLEETYETLDAIERDSATDLREELGDVLFQVFFHARVAEERSDSERFDIDDVAGDITAKLIRRHPHVFAETVADTPAAVEENWDAIKKAEKQRTSATDGVPTALPALALTAKLYGRARRAGVDPPLPTDDSFGARLVRLAVEAADAGVDAELALRKAAHRYTAAIRRLEGQIEEQSAIR